MKKLLFLFSLISFSLTAQTEVNSNLNSVTVFNQSAEIKRTGSFNFKKGEETIVLTGISTNIIPSSLQVKFQSKNSRLLSAKYERNFMINKPNNPKIEALQKDLESIQDQLSDLAVEKSSLVGMEQILNKNQDLGAAGSGFTPQQVLELSEVYRKKYLEIKKEIKAIEKTKKEVNQRRSQVQNQLNEMNATFNKPTGNIVLLVESKTDGNVNFTSTYLVNGAGWSPLYDIRSEGVTANVMLDYKANIYQNTGIDWKDVDIVVSTGNPSQNNNRPILNPLHASIQTYNAYGYGAPNKKKASGYNLYSNSRIDNTVYSSEDKLEEKNSAPQDELSNGSIDMDQEIEEIAFANTAVSQNQMSVEYAIPSKKTIISDGTLNLMSLKVHDLKTDYIYHSVPKLNKGAFLLAKVTDWTKYNLVYGQANIFFEGAFVGETYINPNITSDTLLLSLGKDDNITIERKVVEDFTKTKNVGTNKKITYAYDVIIKNKKSVAIDIEVMDQVPVSQNDKIEVTIDSKGNGKHNEKNGSILWTYSLDPAESVIEKFVYTVKHPKKESVIGIK